MDQTFSARWGFISSRLPGSRGNEQRPSSSSTRPARECHPHTAAGDRDPQVARYTQTTASRATPSHRDHGEIPHAPFGRDLADALCDARARLIRSVPTSCDVTQSRPVTAPIARETRATFENKVNVWVFKTGCLYQNRVFRPHWVFLSAPAIGVESRPMCAISNDADSDRRARFQRRDAN